MLVAWVDRGKREFKEVVLPALRALGCEYRVDDHLTKADPEDVVLAFGKPRLEKLQKSGVAPGNRAIQSLRGRQLGKPDQSKYLVTWDPTQCAFDSARKPEIEWDIRLAARLSETGSLFPQLGDYLQVDTFDAVVQALDGVDIGDPKLPIAIDLETLGTDYMDPEAFIVAISMTFEAGTSYVVVNPPESLSSQLDYIVNHPRAKVYGANFKFDMLWLREKWGIENFDAFVLDTTLVGSLLDENRSNSLNLHAKVYTDIGGYDDPFNEKYDKSRMDLIPVDDLVTYAGGDTDAGFRVAIRLRKDLMKRKRLRRFYQELLHPAMIAVTKMEHRGMCVDQQTYADLGYQLDQQMEKSLEEMREHMTGHLLHKYKDNPDPTRPVVIRDFLFNKRYLGLTPKILTEKTKEPSTAGEHFEMFADHKVAGPFIESLITYRQAQKTKSTYVDGFVKHLRSDGRFHPSYLLFRGQFHGDSQKDDDSGGRTGRTSVKEPAYQTIPKHTVWAKPLRRAYVPPPGMVILDIDFSQGELRITACIADESTMIEVYRSGGDLHLKTGAQLNGIELAEALAMKEQGDPRIKTIRQGGKAGNFGLIYGMGAEGFVDYALKAYGVVLTLREAETFIDVFFDTYSGLRPWHETTKKIAHQRKHIESPLGRIRHLPLINSFANAVRSQAERQAVNAGVQATLTDMGLLALAELDARYPDLWAFGFTHDSLSFYVPEDNWMEWAVRIRDVMENLPLAKFDWHPQLQFPVEVELGVNNLADTEEITLAA